MNTKPIAPVIPILHAGSPELLAAVHDLNGVENAANGQHSAAKRIVGAVHIAAERCKEANANFIAVIDDPAAQPAFADNVIASELEHRNAVILANVVEEAGGADGIRDAVLYADETFKIAAGGFMAKGVALREIQPIARKALGAARDQQTQLGLNMALMERTADVLVIRAHVERIEAEIQNADVMANYCRNRKPGDRHQHSFATIQGTLAAPLPATLPTQMQTAAA